MTLAVTLTATYPRTLPLLSIKEDEGLREGTRYKLQKTIETKPKELLAEEQAMIMEIVNACQDILEDAAQAAAAGLELPSLEEERAAHEETAAKLAEEQKEEEEKRKRLESMEEERTCRCSLVSYSFLISWGSHRGSFNAKLVGLTLISNI